VGLELGEVPKQQAPHIENVSSSQFCECIGYGMQTAADETRLIVLTFPPDSHIKQWSRRRY
jgi:hypothetical protein